jgi:hypothetical protein
MQIKGSCEIHVVDSRTKKVKQVIKQNNLILNHTLLSVLGWDARGMNSYNGANISISTSTTPPTPNSSSLANIVATGYVPSGVSNTHGKAGFSWYPNTSPPYAQIQNRIDFTGTARTFNSVGLTNVGSGNNQNTTGTAFAYLVLDTPCTQGAYDYLDIFYRIQFFSLGQGFVPQAILDFATGFMPVDGRFHFFIGHLYASLCKMPANNHPYINPYYGEGTGSYSGYTGSGITGFGWSSGTRVDSHFKFKMALNYDLNTNNGLIFNMMLQGTREDGFGPYSMTSFQPPASPFQNLFSHSADATVPFFDSLKLASGNGKIYTSGTWLNKWPEFYKFTIIAGGATGIATYKWSVRRHLGFNGNTYSDRIINVPFRNWNAVPAVGVHGWRDENNDVLRYSATQVVQYDDTGVTLLDLLDGSYKNWDSTTIPALPVTQARQCATDGSKIYVGCRNTGLWVIDVAANTVSNLFSVGCYGVDVGRGNVVYTLIAGGLYRSSDWSTPLNFTYAGITDGNWNRVYFLKADPEHVEDRLAIVMQPATASNRRVVWYRANASIIPAGVFQFNGFGDAEGVCYWIGTNYGTEVWQNPHTAGRVTVVMSSIGAGTHANMVNRQGGQNNHTQNIANSWIAIDLGSGNTLTPSYYSLQQRGVDGNYAIRNWKFQGTNNAASNSISDLNAATWTDLDVRVNDISMGVNVDAWAGYTANATQGYRWLRILQTGLNSSNDNHLILGEFEFYGTFDSTTPSRIPPSRTITTFVGAESSNIKPWSASLDVSDTGGFWASGAGRLSYASTATASLGVTLASQQLTHSVYGSDRYYKISFYKNWLVGQSQVVDIAGAVQNTYSSFADKAFILHMDGGIVLTNREMRSLFTDNGNLVWENYGWNGTAWELNHAGAKTTHATDQPLANGINIRFQDGDTSPHFVANDFYTQGVCYGLLKSNADTVFFSSAWYSKPCRFGYPVQSGLTVPAASPYTVTLSAASELNFVRLETDSPELIQLTLNGQPVVTTYIGGTTPPAPMEIRVDASGNGIVEFNSADSGKTIGGTYAWIGN